jgi:HSP20 family protein
MALMKWDPFREFQDLFERYSRSLGVPAGGNQELVAVGDWTPRVDIAETETEFHIHAEIPDVKKDDVSVTVDNRVLTIRGERKQEKEEKGKKFHRVERHYGSFARSFTLPDNVDESKINATFKDGVLNITIAKSASKPKAVSVKVD